RVPDPPDVEPVADGANELVERHRLAPLHDHVGRAGARQRLELPPSAGVEPEAVAGDERGAGGLRVRAELLGQLRVAEQALGLVPGREAADEDAVPEEVRATGREPLARDALRAHEAGERTVVVDAEARRGHPLPELTRERRAERIDRARRERR